MSYWIAGIDVHKRMLAVVVADVEVEGEYHFERRTVGTSPDQLGLNLAKAEMSAKSADRLPPAARHASE